MEASRSDGKAMAFAGLWDIWKADTSAAPIVSCTIIATDANREMKFVHDRISKNPNRPHMM
ncbi:MAG: SOS response-associated peptidase family protein [Chlorobiaceae bacterium]